MKVAAICDKDTAIGLRLAGIKDVYTPGNDLETFNLINKLIEEKFGVVFINEAISNKLGKRLYDIRLQVEVPIIVEIPDKKGHLPEYVDYISKLIKKAVGIEVYKQK
ncbi:MAG: V-type ATP synthase subunit F [Thermoplasmata archaeon]|nr:V-type ATP synthase subunit F [Thermoplasmata archaeon]